MLFFMILNLIVLINEFVDSMNIFHLYSLVKQVNTTVCNVKVSLIIYIILCIIIFFILALEIQFISSRMFFIQMRVLRETLIIFVLRILSSKILIHHSSLQFLLFIVNFNTSRNLHHNITLINHHQDVSIILLFMYKLYIVNLLR